MVEQSPKENRSPLPHRRDFLRFARNGVIAATELGIIATGGWLLFRRALRRILTAGVEDRRFSAEAALHDLPDTPIPFEDLSDGETLLGKSIRFSHPEREPIDVEAGFVSAPVGRDLRLRIFPSHTFRTTDTLNGVPASTSVLDVIRENRAMIRLCSEHGAALFTVADCATIATKLAESTDQHVIIRDVPYELRLPFQDNGRRDLHFERVRTSS